MLFSTLELLSPLVCPAYLLHCSSMHHLLCLNTKPNINSHKSSIKNTADTSQRTRCFRSPEGSHSRCLTVNGKLPWNSLSQFNNNAQVLLSFQDRGDFFYCCLPELDTQTGFTPTHRHIFEHGIIYMHAATNQHKGMRVHTRTQSVTLQAIWGFLSKPLLKVIRHLSRPRWLPVKGFPVVNGCFRSQRFQPLMQSEEVIQ